MSRKNTAKSQRKKPKYKTDMFVWSQEEFTLKEFGVTYAGHAERAPFLILSTVGYMGRDEWMHGIASGEVRGVNFKDEAMYWLYGLAKQPRVVIKDRNHKYFSVPDDYDRHVQPLDQEGSVCGRTMNIREMLNQTTNKYFRFEDLGKSRTISYYDGADYGSTMPLGDYEVMDTYVERFLVVHTLLPEGLHELFTLIPMYMPVEVAMAVGKRRRDLDDFHRELLQFKTFTDSVKHDYAVFLKEEAEIMLFDGVPEEGEYEYLTPAKFLAKRDSETTGPQTAIQSNLDPTPELSKKELSSASQARKARFRFLHQKCKDDGKGRPPKIIPRQSSTVGASINETKTRKGLAKVLSNLHIRGKPGSSKRRTVSNSALPAIGKTGKLPLAPPPEVEEDEEDLLDYEDVTEHVVYERDSSLYPELNTPSTEGIQKGFDLSHPVSSTPIMPVLLEVVRTFQTGKLPSERGIPVSQPHLSGSDSLDSDSDVQELEDEVIDYGPAPELPPPRRRIPPAAPQPLEKPDRQQNACSSQPQPKTRTASGSEVTKKVPPNVPAKPRIMPGRSMSESDGCSANPASAAVTIIPPPDGKPKNQAVVRPNVRSKPTRETILQRISRRMNLDEADDKMLKQLNPVEEPTSTDSSRTTDKKNQDAHSADRTPLLDIQSVPEDISCLTIDQISQCLTWLKLPHLVEAFREAQIDGKMLRWLVLDGDVTREEFGVNAYEFIKLSRFANDNWRPK